MDTTLTQKFPFILNRNLAKANCTENHACTSCDTVVLDLPSFEGGGGELIGNTFLLSLSSSITILTISNNSNDTLSLLSLKLYYTFLVMTF